MPRAWARVARTRRPGAGHGRGQGQGQGHSQVRRHQGRQQRAPVAGFARHRGRSEDRRDPIDRRAWGGQLWQTPRLREARFGGVPVLLEGRPRKTHNDAERIVLFMGPSGAGKARCSPFASGRATFRPALAKAQLRLCEELAGRCRRARQAPKFTNCVAIDQPIHGYSAACTGAQATRQPVGQCSSSGRRANAR